MGKSRSRKLLMPALAGAAVYLAFLSYQQVGGLGVMAVAVVAAVVYGVWKQHVKRRDEALFNKLVLFLLVKRLPPEQDKLLEAGLAGRNSEQVALMQLVQKLREAMTTALASRQRSIAESGMQSVRDLYARIRQEHPDLITPNMRAEMDRILTRHEQVFNARFYTNVAEGLLEQAGRQGTDKPASNT